MSDSGSDLPIAIARFRAWRAWILGIVVFGSLMAIFLRPPIPQPSSYHEFADRREILGVPNFFDVASNLPFLVVGIMGIVFCLRSNVGAFRSAWLALFTGIAVVSIGSAYYHWNPNNETLVWDRLPMTIGFIGLAIALLGEYIDAALGRLLVPAGLLGLGSVAYWHWFDDLRLYLWIQLTPLLIVAGILLLYRKRYSHEYILVVALGCYVAAKVFELFDRKIFAATGELMSGHSIKHVTASLGCLALLALVQRRQLLDQRITLPSPPPAHSPRRSSSAPP